MKKKERAIVAFKATLTSRYQITVPSAVRSALQLEKNDLLSFELSSHGVQVKKVAAPSEREEHRDLALEAFLAFIENDISTDPKSVTAYTDEEAEEDLAFLNAYKQRNP